MKIKQNKGIGLSDAIIAVVILMIFSGVIFSVSYNIYIQSHFIKKNEQATNYIVDVFEYGQGLIYEELTSKNLGQYLKNKYDNVKVISGKYTEETEISGGYTIYINVQDKYSEYIKQVDITVAYKLGGKNKTVNMSTLINK